MEHMLFIHFYTQKIRTCIPTLKCNLFFGGFTSWKIAYARENTCVNPRRHANACFTDHKS